MFTILIIVVLLLVAKTAYDQGIRRSEKAYRLGYLTGRLDEYKEFEQRQNIERDLKEGR